MTLLVVNMLWRIAEVTLSTHPPIQILLLTDILPGVEQVGAAVYVEDVTIGLTDHGAEFRVLMPDDAKYYNRLAFRISPALAASGTVVRVPRHGRIGRWFFKLDPRAVVMGMFVPVLKWVLRDPNRIERLSLRLDRWRGRRRNRGSTESASVHDLLPPGMRSRRPGPAHLQWVRDEIRRNPPDVLLVSYLWLADYFSCVPSDRPIVKCLMTHDLFHLRYATGAGGKDWTISREQEAAVLSQADILLAIQKDEAAVMRQMVPHATVLTRPMSAVPRWSQTDRVVGKQVLFVGSLSEHNVQGLAWFLETVWPAVCSRHSDAMLHVVGTICQAIAHSEKHQQVTWHGIVSDLTPRYVQAAAVICPLQMGSGLKIKVIEAFSHGKAVVGTSIAAQGLDGAVQCGAMCIADDSTAFAAMLSDLLGDPAMRQQIQHMVREYVIKYCDTQSINRQVMQAIVDKCRSGPFNQESM